jgi:hypothetical protein
MRASNAKFMAKVNEVHAKRVDGRITPQYSATQMFKTWIALFFFQVRSVNAYMESDVIHGREDRPGGRTLAYYAEASRVAYLNQALWDQVHTAMRLKQLDGLRGSDGKWTMAFDGVSLSYSTKRHCEKCLKTTKDGVTSYHHSLLVASIVHKVKKVSIVVAVIPIENMKNEGTDKQACELKAAHEMLDHLRKMDPYLRYHITVDALYLAAGFIEHAVRLGHSVTMPLAKENMKIHEILDVRFGNGRSQVKLETVKTITTVDYDSEDIAPYWDALQKANPQIALHGMRRTIVDRVTGEVRQCPIVTTLVPTEKNAMRISDIQREKWQEENKTFNMLKNHHHLEHVFNHKAQTQIFIFAAIATNMRTIAFLRHPPQKHVKKPLALASVIQAILTLCHYDPLGLFPVFETFAAD